MKIAGGNKSSSCVADWPHCCDFQGGTCGGMQCFSKPQNHSKIVHFIALCGQALSPFTKPFVTKTSLTWSTRWWYHHVPPQWLHPYLTFRTLVWQRNSLKIWSKKATINCQGRLKPTKYGILFNGFLLVCRVNDVKSHLLTEGFCYT